MRALQVNLSYVPAAVFLNKENKAILLSRPGVLSNFIDYQDGNDMVAWTKDSLCVGDNSYEYDKWYVVEEGSDLQKYFRAILEEPLADLV